MLAASIPPYPPITYSLLWFFIGLALLLIMVTWFGAVLWSTRRKPIATLSNIATLTTQDELDRLKKKYLKLIDECYQKYQNQDTDLRGLHRGLSMTVRYFVFEVRHFPAQKLTLTDLRRAPYPALTKIIEVYYPSEFAALKTGDALESVAAAKNMVEQWV